MVADDERGAGVDRRVGELTLLSGRGRSYSRPKWKTAITKSTSPATPATALVTRSTSARAVPALSAVAKSELPTALGPSSATRAPACSRTSGRSARARSRPAPKLATPSRSSVASVSSSPVVPKSSAWLLASETMSKPALPRVVASAGGARNVSNLGRARLCSVKVPSRSRGAGRCRPGAAPHARTDSPCRAAPSG